MARVSEIRSALESWLVTQTNIPANISPYIEDTTDFPSLNVGNHRARRTTQYIGNSQSVKTYFVSVRAYVWSDDDSIVLSESVCYDLERAIEEFESAHRALEIYSAQVNEVHTDEGLFSPYGVIDLDCTIMYEEEYT
jgi:hypothetical protein